MLSLADVLAALAPRLQVAGAENVRIRRVCVDSRQAGADSLFVALYGERADGHDYVDDAFEAGAVAALVERPVEGAVMIDAAGGTGPTRLETPVAVVVPDSLKALQRLAKARRMARPELRVIGVTGSVGKTTTKDVIAAVLSQAYMTLKNAGNFNNEIGLPLTLMSLEPEHERAVLEMGMYALGEIALLCDIAGPHVGVVTNVEPIHLARLGTIERIAQAKGELVEALPEDGIAILNGDDRRVRAMGAMTKAPIMTFGLRDDNTVWADAITSHGLDGVSFVAHVDRSADLDIDASSRALRVEMLGRHAVMPALAAVAAGLVEGLSWQEIERGLLAQGRGLRLAPKAGMNGATLLDDTYNASPTSTLAALDLLSELPGRHLAALGDMLELGASEVEGHRKVGGRCAQVLDSLVTVGERARHIAEGALDAGLPSSALCSVPDNESAVEILSELLREGDTLLVKGSRGMAMESIVQALEER